MKKGIQPIGEPEKPSLVPPIISALISLVVPGLGHALARSYRRGLVLLASFITILGLLIWRIRVIARYETGLLDIALKAFDLKPLTLILTILVIILYVFIAIDAYYRALRPSRGFGVVFVVILIAFFGLGWVIGRIDPGALISGARRGAPILLDVLWPWQAAYERGTEALIGASPILVPCPDTPVPSTIEDADKPYLLAEPNCGISTDEEGNPGTTITLSGGNFATGIEAEVWWRDPLRNPFRNRDQQTGEALTVIPDDTGQFQVQVIIPYRNIPPSAAEGPLEWAVEVRQTTSVGGLLPSEDLLVSIEKMIDTIFLGMMATIFGIALAIPLSFMAARNLMSANPVTLAIYFINRTILNIIRSIEPLIWAVIAVIVVGLGPFAGIIALSVHSVAALGKLYSESIESIDPGPIEAIQATGANWLQTVMYAVVPQIIPPFVSFTIYRWDINVRMSTVIGLVGGGGIGYILIQRIKIFNYKAAGIAVWFVAITVAVLDYVSSEIRRRFV
ncbi:MAG: phosphonate ABC transporter, permease protein PhnE [Anaerolineales bacterium]|jgi:phosphonate transport system permease protein